MAHVDFKGSAVARRSGRTAAKARDTKASLALDAMCFSGESMREAKSPAVRVKASIMLDLPRVSYSCIKGSISNLEHAV